ncbi:MAG: alpha-hydroxy acid oxidase [Steroidobacteraceae bacterium]
MSRTVITGIEDLRQRARRRIPRAIFEYADHGSYDEVTLRRNRSDLDALSFRPRVMVDFSKLDLATTLLGETATMPLAIAPTGLTGLFHADGEMLGARAAEAFGIPFTLSTMSICSIEDVRSVTRRPFWFQLYLMRDRGFSTELIERAKAASCSTLMLTVDMQIQGFRRRDPKNGLSVPPRLTVANVFDVLGKPAWALKVLFGRRHTFGNLVGRLPQTGGLSTLAQWISTQFDPAVTWKDIAWVRERWPGKLIVKGIMDAGDVDAALDAGVDALVVSNHGGRQLDGSPSTIEVLPEIAAAVNGRCEVLFDGGIRSGQDLLKALALGARGGFIGKAFLYALAAGGEAGVTKALELIQNELRVSLALAGRTRVGDVGPDILRPRSAG